MRKRLIVGVIAAVVVGVGVAWAIAPIVTAQALIRAAKAGDAPKMQQLVDFPALRESLKTELNAELVARMRRDPDVVENGLGGLGLMLAPMILSGAVDTFITPEVVAQMVTTAEAPDPTRRDPPEPKDDRDGTDIHQSWGYRDLNHFAVTLTDRDRPDQRLALILDRRGPVTWRLSAVDIQNTPGA